MSGRPPFHATASIPGCTEANAKTTRFETCRSPPSYQWRSFVQHSSYPGCQLAKVDPSTKGCKRTKNSKTPCRHPGNGVGSSQPDKISQKHQRMRNQDLAKDYPVDRPIRHWEKKGDKAKCRQMFLPVRKRPPKKAPLPFAVAVMTAPTLMQSMMPDKQKKKRW